MSLIPAFILFNIFFSIICTITSLPVTSKPIENTPEHLAWEAWIMVPSSHDKSRKITPKSIFIVPNGTNNNNGGGSRGTSTFLPQIQCPPGHTVDNLKCIPTVSIDQSQILITRLANLIPSTDKYNGSNDDANTNYDYDYEYDTYEADESQSFTLNNNGDEDKNKNENIPSSLLSSDYSGEPLKINLSLEKLPPLNQNNEMKQNITDNMRPSQHRNLSDVTTLQDKRSDVVESFHNEKALIPTISDSTIKEETPKLEGEIIILKRNSTVEPSEPTVVATTVPSILDFKLFNKSLLTNQNKNTVPILSLSEAELLITINNNTKSTTTEDSQDYDLHDDSQTTHLTTTTTEYGIELITSAEDIKSPTLKDEIENDSFILDESNLKTTTDFNDSTENEDQVFTTTSVNTETDDENYGDDDKTTITINSDVTTTLKPIEDYKIPIKENLSTVENQPKTSEQSISKSDESIEMPNDAAPLMEAVEKHKRVETTTNPTDIREQLRIINQIVEENKKRATAASKQTSSIHQQQPFGDLSRIRFPEDKKTEQHLQQGQSNTNHYPGRYGYSDYLRFPQDSQFSSSQSMPVPPVLHKPQSDSLYLFNRFLPSAPPSPTPLLPSSIQPSVIPSPSIINLNNGDDVQQNSKPFWWLPTGWEVDRTGDRPLMVRFWSRIPIEPSSSPNQHHQKQNTRIPSQHHHYPSLTGTTTSGYRENSKSPTENLYRQEILSQQGQQQHQQQEGVYSILRAKPWKHNDR